MSDVEDENQIVDAKNGAIENCHITRMNQYQAVNVQCTAAKREIYKVKEFIDKMTHADAKMQALELFDRAYQAFDRLQAFIGSRG